MDDLTDEIKKQSENFEKIIKKDSYKNNNKEDSEYEDKSDKKVDNEEDIEKEKKMQDRTKILHFFIFSITYGKVLCL